MTTPFEAFEQGKEAYKANPGGNICKLLPYACSPLSIAWIDGWNDADPNYVYKRSWGVEGGRCPLCYYGEVKRTALGRIKCLKYNCKFEIPTTEEERQWYLPWPIEEELCRIPQI